MLQLNLANALLEGGQPGEAATILNRYTFNNKDDVNGWDLLAQAKQNWKSRSGAGSPSGRHGAGWPTRSGHYPAQQRQLTGKIGSLQQARYDARIDQLRQLQERFKPYQKM